MASTQDRFLDLVKRVQEETIDERTFSTEIDEIAEHVKGPLGAQRLVQVRHYAAAFYKAVPGKPSIRDYAKASLLLALGKLSKPL